jgi:hemerythrin
MSGHADRQRYHLGISVIDEEHKMLLNTVAELHVAMTAGCGRSAIAGILCELLEYAKRHFSTEERYMLSFEYAGYAAHKAAHDAFLVRIQQLQRQTDGETSVTLETFYLLQDWLRDHVESMDAHYVDCFHEHGL